MVFWTSRGRYGGSESERAGEPGDDSILDLKIAKVEWLQVQRRPKIQLAVKWWLLLPILRKKEARVLNIFT